MYRIERENKISRESNDEKMHVYEVDPMIVDYGPGQINTFRDQKAFRTSIGRDSFRTNTFSQTPKKNIKENKKSILNTIASNGSAKKTVRFFESPDGLLKTVPFESSFKDFEFIG